MIKVTLHDGRTVEVDTDDPARAAKVAHGYSQKNPVPQHSTLDTVAGIAGNFAEGALPGAAGFTGGLISKLSGGTFEGGQRAQEQRQKQATQEHPYLSGAAQVAGIGAGLALPAFKIARGATLGAKALAGLKTGAAYGALSGGLSSHSGNLQDRASDAIGAGMVSGALGGVTPFAVRGATALASPARPVVQHVANRIGQAANSIADHLPKAPPRVRSIGRYAAKTPVAAAADHELDQTLRAGINPETGRPFTPHEVLAEVERRQGLGVPAVAADIHEGARRGFGKAAREPGPAVQAVRAAIQRRQEEAAARQAQHVREALGTTANVEVQAETIRREAQAAARPHYEAAYAAPGASDSEIADIIDNQSGAMRDALAHARELALRDKRDPTALGFNLNDAGEVTLTRVPSFETLDLIKRGLEGVADKTRDLGGNLDNDGRTILGMAKPLVRRMREINPSYAEALDTYGTQIGGRDAIRAGRDSLRDGADDIANVIADYSPWERQNFALGNRSAIAGDVSEFGRMTPQGNAAARVRQNFGRSGSDTYEAMQDVHGADAVDRLAEVTNLEDDAYRTWSATRSSRAPLGDMGDDDRRVLDAASGVLQAGLGHPLAAIGSVVKALATGSQNREAVDARVASVLAEQDVPALRGAIREVGRERARRAVLGQKGAQTVQRGSRFLGDLTGAGMILPAEDAPDY